MAGGGEGKEETEAVFRTCELVELVRFGASVLLSSSMRA